MNNLSRLGFIHSSGKIIPIHRTENDIKEPDHTEYAVKNPHIFGMSHEEVKKVAGNHYEGLIKGTRAESVPLKHHLSNKGYSTYYRTARLKKTPSGEPYTEHQIHIGTVGKYLPKEHFIPHMTSILPHLKKIGNNDVFSVHVNNLKDTSEMVFHSIPEINKFINSGSLPREKSISQHVSSSDLLRALGKKPESMTTAEWKNIRTIGDSVGYGLPSFKEFLYENWSLVHNLSDIPHEDRSKYIYHVTYEPRVNKILKKGLVPRIKGKGNFPSLKAETKGKAFFTNHRGISYWESNLASANLKHEDDEKLPFILKFPIANLKKSVRRKIKIDELGTKDSNSMTVSMYRDITGTSSRLNNPAPSKWNPELHRRAYSINQTIK